MNKIKLLFIYNRMRFNIEKLSTEPYDREKQILEQDPKKNFRLFDGMEKLKLIPNLS